MTWWRWYLGRGSRIFGTASGRIRPGITSSCSSHLKTRDTWTGASLLLEIKSLLKSNWRRNLKKTYEDKLNDDIPRFVILTWVRLFRLHTILCGLSYPIFTESVTATPFTGEAAHTSFHLWKRSFRTCSAPSLRNAQLGRFLSTLAVCPNYTD